MEKLLINLICELDDKSSDVRMCSVYKTKNFKRKQRELLLKNFIFNTKRRIPKVFDYWRVIKDYPEDIFFDYFRMNRSTFKALVRDLKPFWTTLKKGRIPYSLDRCLYITLWKLSNNGVTFRQLCDRFNVAKGTVHKIFYKTIGVICQLKREIAWPSMSQQPFVMEGFQNSREHPFPFVIGCVDGTHVKIPKPKTDPISYYNRKGFYSINMQAICDSKFKFLDVYIGFPGSCHDANVWSNSPIYKSIVDGRIPLAPNAVILGDSAYPISKYLLTPYKDNGHLTREQKKFNFCLSSTRVLIEQSFGILKNKFRILEYLDTETLTKASKIILACTILHNFIISKGTSSEYIPTINAAADIDTPNMLANETTYEDENGVTLRNNLTALFSS